MFRPWQPRNQNHIYKKIMTAFIKIENMKLIHGKLCIIKYSKLEMAAIVNFPPIFIHLSTEEKSFTQTLSGVHFFYVYLPIIRAMLQTLNLNSFCHQNFANLPEKSTEIGNFLKIHEIWGRGGGLNKSMVCFRKKSSFFPNHQRWRNC